MVTLRTDAEDAEKPGLPNPYSKGGVHSVGVTHKCFMENTTFSGNQWQKSSMLTRKQQRKEPPKSWELTTFLKNQNLSEADNMGRGTIGFNGRAEHKAKTHVE